MNAFFKWIATYLGKMYARPMYRILLMIIGAVFMVPAFIYFKVTSRKNKYALTYKGLEEAFERSGEGEALKREILESLENKNEFLGQNHSEQNLLAQRDKIFAVRKKELLTQRMRAENPDLEAPKFSSALSEYLSNAAIGILFVVGAFPALILVLLYSNPYVKYISERLFMMFFVIFGVTFLVFTILYMSPMDAAVNILGRTATPEQVDAFNAIYGLDEPYHIQLVQTFKNLITFDLGKSYAGNEDVFTALIRRFPVTLRITFFSLVVSVAIAIPAGIISAIKPYSSHDYIVMLLALVGLSIPTFWMGLILILTFSINSNTLPAMFAVSDWKSYIMPSMVLGMSLAATVARMTRSSMLEVVNQDFIVTAKAKGLSTMKVIMRHALWNAMIPIITVIGLQFGTMLGGAAVTEKVFNISGIGSFIVDKQFIPDVPVVLSGVVYVAVIISVVNLLVDILYGILDPRIKSKMKSY